MFGYVTVCEPELKMKDFRKYRSYYCGLCKVLKEKYGNVGQMTLTYDMTFLVILLNSLYEKELQEGSSRCKTHPVKKQQMRWNEITEYGADMNLLLSYYHLLDDWQDERKPGSLAGVHILGRRVKKTAEKYPGQCRAIQRELKALRKYEDADSQDLDAVSGCFGRLMEVLFLYRRDMWEKDLRRLGFFLGKFIYIMDAYEDLEKDKKEGSYNPLRSLCEKPDYEERCASMLCMMMAESSAAFEKLPCLQDADILRNILYAGVWNRYNRLKEKKAGSGEKSGEERSQL